MKATGCMLYSLFRQIFPESAHVGSKQEFPPSPMAERERDACWTLLANEKGECFVKPRPLDSGIKEGFRGDGRNNFSDTAKRAKEYYNSERYLDYTLASTLWLDLNISELFLRRVDYYYLKQNDSGRSRWMQYHWKKVSSSLHALHTHSVRISMVPWVHRQPSDCRLP